MMSYQEWLNYLLDVIGAIASREIQERLWLGPRPEINWVGDLYKDLGEEFFDDFFNRYSSTFSEEQRHAWKEFQQAFESYGDGLESYPEPQKVIYDPKWQKVRKAAARFVEVFEQKSS